VILVGNCGRDPEVRYMANGTAVANVSIATTSKRKDKSGETIEETQWHRVTFYDKLAEIVGDYVKKGAPIYVEGSLKYGTYTDKQGVEKSTCDIVAKEMQLLGGRDQSAAQQRPASARPQQAPQKAPAKAGGGFESMDDDVPW
jgi:single-strand DNA-binding protein